MTIGNIPRSKKEASEKNIIHHMVMREESERGEKGQSG